MEAASGCNPAEGWPCSALQCLCQSVAPGEPEEDAPAQNQATSTHWCITASEGLTYLLLVTKQPPRHPSVPLRHRRRWGAGARPPATGAGLPNCPSSHPLLKAPLVILSLQPGVQGGSHPIPLLPVPALPHLRSCFCQRNPRGLCWVGLWCPGELTGASTDPWPWTSSCRGISVQPS